MTEYKCPKCGTKIMQGKIVTEGYAHYCQKCDEDFYTIEVKEEKQK